jgi:hypothetical protein
MMKEVIVPASIGLQRQSSKRNLGSGLDLFVTKNFFSVDLKGSQSINVLHGKSSNCIKVAEAMAEKELRIKVGVIVI